MKILRGGVNMRGATLKIYCSKQGNTSEIIRRAPVKNS